VRFASIRRGVKKKGVKTMDKYIRIVYIDGGELKKILKKVESVFEATEELDRIVVLEFPIMEFSFYHN